MPVNNNLDGQLAKIEARIARAKRSARHLAAAPPVMRKIDDLKKSGDYIDAIHLKRRGALSSNVWTAINEPPLHPAVKRMVCGRTCLQISHHNGSQQTLPIVWHNPTGKHDTPLFRCGCGRRSRKLYPLTGKGYSCRWCVSVRSALYQASGKSRPDNRIRVRAPIFHGVPNDRRDPTTGRFLPAAAPSPSPAPAVSSPAPPALPPGWVALPWGSR